jgi:hypothetical protein
MSRRPRTVGPSGVAPHNILRVLTGKSLLIDLERRQRLGGQPTPRSDHHPRQVMVNGLADGETSVIVWDRSTTTRCTA